jgi:hypothetical protein
MRGARQRLRLEKRAMLIDASHLRLFRRLATLASISMRTITPVTMVH